MSRAVKADEISVVEPTQPLRLARQSKDNREARTFVPASSFIMVSFLRAGSYQPYFSLRLTVSRATDKTRLRLARKATVSDRLSPVSGSLAEFAFPGLFPETSP